MTKIKEESLRINIKRIRLLKQGDETNGPVVYWMSHDQRVHDNWALIFAQIKALKKKRPLVVVFNLVPKFLEATIRQYGFMLKGLKQVEIELQKLNIPFFITKGRPEIEIPKFINELKASVLITDFSPLKIKRNWEREISKQLTIPFYQVDAHNIIPCFYLSTKAEPGAYAIRRKIHQLLLEFLDDFPELVEMKSQELKSEKINWAELENSLEVNREVKEVDWLKPGELNAQRVLNDFLENKLTRYAKERNDPNKNALSNLSPYLHFGQISAQRVALVINRYYQDNPSAAVFLEELIVRRELAENFCYFDPNYDSFEGFPEWAKETLNKHRKDKREYVYTLEEFEHAKTHDDLWNAAQMEMVLTGKMHGYMRMYWAKKILEWSESPEEALRVAIYLNDKYELDGRDPNGYVGCAWAIGGVHDRPFQERPVFGKIRYMSFNGMKRKFDVQSYIDKFLNYQQKLIP